ncbi:MAG: hypothetical protein KIT56_08630 [Gammaproteobacteria bacterium]|nr:hypothetical protein [Gammaproteobacteria bacterium]MCW5583922.1 hypothetical protein [Gammaproteobacteria bacterium]
MQIINKKIKNNIEENNNIVFKNTFIEINDKETKKAATMIYQDYRNNGLFGQLPIEVTVKILSHTPPFPIPGKMNAEKALEAAKIDHQIALAYNNVWKKFAYEIFKLIAEQDGVTKLNACHYLATILQKIQTDQYNHLQIDPEGNGAIPERIFAACDSYMNKMNPSFITKRSITTHSLTE